MPVIGWSESVPDGQDSLGQGDDVIKSLKTSLRIGLDGEHVWPSGGGDAGVHRLGSARPYVGTQSLVSSSGTDGRLMWASDTSMFFHVGSGGTALIGGAQAVSLVSYPGGAPPQRQYWALDMGQAITNNLGGVAVGFSGSGFSVPPYVQLTPFDGTILGARVNLGNASVTGAGFNVFSYRTTGASASSISFFWQAIGLRAL